LKKLNVFRHVDTAFTARHIVSVASSETGIAGALQHHVLFICHENGGRYQSVEGIYASFYVRGMKIQAWRCLSAAKGGEESKSKIKNGISKN